MTEGKFKPESLEKPFDKRLHVTNRYKSFNCTGVEAHHYIRRFNEATGYRWSLEVVSSDIVRKIHKDKKSGKYYEGAPSFVVLVRLSVPELGIVKEQYGGSGIVGDDPEDCRKAAVADGMKKCMSLMGLGSELYGKEEKEPEHDTGSGNRPKPDDWRAVIYSTGMPFSSQDEKDKCWNYIEAMCKKKFGVGKEKIDKMQASQLAEWLSKGRGGKNGQAG